MDQAQDILLEIGTEEIPARFIPPAISQLKDNIYKLLKETGINFKEITSMGTPRRLVVMVKDVSSKQDDREEKLVGPPAKIAFNEDGSPTKAAIGFAKSQGVNPSELSIEETDRGPYVVLKKKIYGLNTIDILPDIFINLITGINFPKNMKWGPEHLRFARPIRWIVALYGDQLIPFEIGGIKNNYITRCHRFLGPNSIELTSSDADTYIKDMEEAFVIVDQQQRRKILLESAKAAVQKAAGSVKGQLLEDRELLELNTYLTEYPFAVCGRFEEKFLKIPHPVLITAMKEHQKYFAVTYPNGDLAPFFVAINNIKPSDPAIVTRGHERVLRARLSDAAFFFEEDTKQPLSSYVEELKGMVYQKGLGTIFDKTNRIIALSDFLAQSVAPDTIDTVKRAAYLSKADLLTEMVGEFPTLQGIMGKHYALLSGEPTEVAVAIEEHYMPTRADGDLPDTMAGAIVGIADKIDSICSMFSIGHEPSGTQDPYGLRRLAIGILRILSDKQIRINLHTLVKEALNQLEAFTQIKPDTANKILNFIKRRFLHDQLTKGRDQKVIEAALRVGFHDPNTTAMRIAAIENFQSKPNSENLIMAFKRVVNILKDSKTTKPDPSLFSLSEEKTLYNEYIERKKQVEHALSEDNYEHALEILLGLKPAIDAFFDNVMVMDKEKSIRENRLNLLGEIKTLFMQVADISAL